MKTLVSPIFPAPATPGSEGQYRRAKATDLRAKAQDLRAKAQDPAAKTKDLRDKAESSTVKPKSDSKAEAADGAKA